MHASRLSEYVHWIVIADPRRYIFSGPSEYERVIFRDSAGAPFGNGFQGPTATVRDLLKSPYAVPRLKGVIVTRMEMGSSCLVPKIAIPLAVPSVQRYESFM
jgi:hypothetical protein